MALDPTISGEERVGLLERTQREGPSGFALGLADMLLPQAGTTGQAGLGDLLAQFVEYSRLGDVMDVGAALDPNSGLDPLERAVAALPLIGGGLSLGYAGTRAAQRHRQHKAARQTAIQQAAAQAALRAELADLSMLPLPNEALDTPAELPSIESGQSLTPEQVRQAARFFSELGFKHSYPDSAAIWGAHDWDSLAEAWASTPSGSGRNLADQAQQVIRAIGHAVVAGDPGRYAPDADLEVQAFVAAKFAIARWETAKDKGIVEQVRGGFREGQYPSQDDIQRIVSLELATGRIAGPDMVVAPHTRISRVIFDDAQRAHVLLAPAGELLPDRVWDWDKMLPLEGHHGLDRTKAHRKLHVVDYGAQVGQFAANLYQLTQRIPPDPKGNYADVYGGMHATWYPRANKTIRYLAENTGVDPHIISGVMSAMSAQTAWVPDNLVGAIHAVLRVGRPDLIPGTPEYGRLFRGAIEAGDWQYDLFNNSARQRRKDWAGTLEASRVPDGPNELGFDPMYEYYGNPENLMSESGNLLGLDTDAKKRKVQAMLEAGLPPWMVLRMFKTGTFQHSMANPDSPLRIATIDVHNDRATQGTVWLGEALGQRGTRRIRAGETYVDPLLGEELSLEKIEEQRPKLEAIGWSKKEIDSFLNSLAQVPNDFARDRYLAQVEAHALVADLFGIDVAHQVQAAIWPVMQGMNLSSVKKQLEFVKSVDGVRRIVNDLTWDTSIPLMLEGNGSFERTIIGELYSVADRHDGYVPAELENLPVRNQLDVPDQPIVVDQREDGSRVIWADRSYPGVREALRHTVPTGLKVGDRELHLAARPRRVLSVEQHVKEILGYRAEDGGPASGEVRTWMPAPDYQHPGLSPGERLVVEVPHAMRAQVEAMLDEYPVYLPRQVQQVRKIRTRPAVAPVPRETLATARGSQLERILENNDWVTIEADHSDNPDPAARRRLKNRLSRMKNVTFVEVEGWWEGEVNTAFFVTGLTAEQKVKLMHDFDQWAIATPHGIYSHADEGPGYVFLPARGFVFGDEARAQAGYTVMPSGEAFSLVLDDAVEVEGLEWATTDSPLVNREDAVSEIVIDIGNEWGGPTWRDVERVADMLREFGPVRIYTHGVQHARPGWVWANESVFQDQTGIWGSAFYAGEGDQYARNRVDVLMPAEDAAGLGSTGWDAERGRRTPRDAAAITSIDEDLGEIRFDQDLIIKVDPGADVQLPKTGSIFSGIRVNGRRVTDAVLDLTGPVPTIHTGVEMPGPQPGMIPLEFSRGKVKTIRPYDPGDWVEAREALSMVGLFDEGKVVWPTETDEGFQPSHQIRFDDLGRKEITRPVTEDDVQLMDQVEADLGVRVRLELGEYATPQLRDQAARMMRGLFGSGDPKYAAFRETFGDLPAKVWEGTAGIQVSDILDWNGQAYVPMTRLHAATPTSPGRPYHGVVLNERIVAARWARGYSQTSNKRWFVEVPHDVSDFERMLVHEIGHFLEDLSGLDINELASVDNTPVRARVIQFGTYSTQNLHEYLAEVFVRAVFEPHRLTEPQRQMIQRMVDQVRQRMEE